MVSGSWYRGERYVTIRRFHTTARDADVTFHLDGNESVVGVESEGPDFWIYIATEKPVE